jgi:hypothetical protein
MVFHGKFGTSNGERRHLTAQIVEDFAVDPVLGGDRGRVVAGALRLDRHSARRPWPRKRWLGAQQHRTDDHAQNTPHYKTDAVKAGVPHALDHHVGRARGDLIAGELDGRGKQGRSNLDR